MDDRHVDGSLELGGFTKFGRKENAQDAENGAFVSESFAAFDRGAHDAGSKIGAEEMCNQEVDIVNFQIPLQFVI